MYDTSRHTIFVPLTGKCGIGLFPTPEWDGTYKTSDFQVLDGNCFDQALVIPPDYAASWDYSGGGLSAAFVLPPPDPTATGTLQYSVFVKVTSPQKHADMTTCFYDNSLGETYCNTGYTLTLDKDHYRKFVNVSKNLLTVCDAGTGKLAPLFTDAADQYWWEYNNEGLRHAQFRFYPKVADGSPYSNTACTYTTK